MSDSWGSAGGAKRPPSQAGIPQVRDSRNAPPQAVPLRRALLELHRTIIAEERAGYERRAGQVNAAAFLRVLIEDEAYAWLRPLSALIVRMDDEEEDAAALLAETRALVRPDFTGTPFQTRYAWLIEQSPAVAYAHGVVKQALRYATSAWQEPSRSPALPAS